MDRLEFLTRIIERLEKRGWQFRVDTGWGDFDIEIFGSRWVSLQLATAAEPHPGRRQRLRCRLRCVWPLASWTAFFAALGLELAGIGLLRGEHGWPWLLLCTMLAFPWLLRREERGQLRMIAALLDQAAADSGLARLAPPKEPPPGETAK
jgi:hypothetical protein